MKRLQLLAALTLLAGCSALGPDYHRPVTPAPGSWKAPVAQSAGVLPAGAWWQAFKDADLDALEARALKASPQLAAAVARLEQARATARISAADLYPTVSFDPSANRSRQSDTRPLQPGVAAIGYSASDFRTPLDVSYEVDLWGRVRRASESALAQAQSSAADLATVRLTLQADVALNYFNLRELDTEIAVVQKTLELRSQRADLVQARVRRGAASELDGEREQADVASLSAEFAGLVRARAGLENAIAQLLGSAPSEVSIAPRAQPSQPPQIPAGLPAELLQRRPDVAAAERTLAARNAEIGIAQAAYFPRLSLTAALGFESASLSDLIKSGSRIWALGGAVAQPVFDSGRIKGSIDRARAIYAENLANYQQRVLVAFNEVDTALSDLGLLSNQASAQNDAVIHSAKASNLADIRYRAGVANLLDLLDAQRTELAARRSVAQVDGLRLATTVRLIKALGGGWQESALTAPPGQNKP